MSESTEPCESSPAKYRPKIGDKVQVTLEGELTAYDDDLGHFTLRGSSVPDRHVPWDYTLHGGTTFTPVKEPASVDADVPKLEKLAAWLDFQFGAPGVGNQVRSFSGVLIAARAELDRWKQEADYLARQLGTRAHELSEWQGRAVIAEVELAATQRYAEALARGLSDAEARAEGWPTAATDAPETTEKR